jgi:protein TonB
MIAIAEDPSGAARLALALLLALGIHVAFILGVSIETDGARPPQPLRFEMVLPHPEQPKTPEAPAAVPDSGKIQAGVEAIPDPGASPKPTPSPSSAIVAVPPPKPPARPRPVATAKPTPKPTTVTPPAKPPPVAPTPVRPPPAATKPASTAPPPPSRPAKTAQPLAKPPARRPERAAPAGKAAETRPSGPMDSSALLGQIAGLEAETRRRASAGVRGKRVNPNDTQSLEGFYIAAWVRKVEQIGELNFPDIARRLNLNTGPVLDVSIRADGSLGEVRVVRSSGHAELDQAARRIVKLGAPYAPFPPSLSQKYDVLHIARPWRFDPGGRLRGR